MARVSINDCAHFDLRLTQASRALSINRERLVYRLLLVWSQVTEAGCSVIQPRMLALALGKKPDQVVEAFIDAKLAALTDDALDLEPMRALFGDYEWYGDLSRTARSGGQVRAETATRHDDGQYLSRDYHGEILAILATGDHSRSELRQLMRAKNTAVRAAVRELLSAGTIIDRDGRLALADASHHDGPIPPAPVPVPGTQHSVPVPVPVPVARCTSAPAPALALAPARESTHTREREATGNAFSGTGNEEQGAARSLASDDVQGKVLALLQGGPDREPMKPAVLAATAKVEPGQRRQVAEALWAYQRQLRAQLDSAAPDLPFDTIPGGTADAVVLALARYSPAQCRHALEVFAAEGACMRDDGRDPLQYLNGRTNWKPEQLDRAVGSTVQAMRKRHKSAKRPEPVGNPATRNRLA